MSLYGQYIKERENKDIFECDHGFATYLFLSETECYIEDIYVSPEKRKSGLASLLADNIVAIAKEKGCKFLIGSVCLDAKFAEDSMNVLFAYGMKVKQIDNKMIYFYKEI